MKLLLIFLCLAAILALLPSRMTAQNPADALHAPDGNAYSRIVSIYIPPLTNAPFTATVNTEWARQASDGATVTVKNHRLVVRDSQGRIFEERRRFVPADSNSPSLVFQMEFSDPAQHTKYVCFAANKVCNLISYFAPLSEPTIAAGPIGDGKRYLSRADLGKSDVNGIETIGTRETISTNPGAVGNDREVSLTKEFWYSPKLGVNLIVKRIDPLQGTQVFTVSDIQLAEPDPRLFVLPAGYKVVDQRSAMQPPAK
jgi:hypothetical protein